MRDEIDFQPIDFIEEDEGIDFEPIEFELDEPTSDAIDSSDMSYWGVPRLSPTAESLLSEDEPTVSTGEALARGAAQGITFGFGDELSAGLGALLPPTETDVATDRGRYLADMLDRYRSIRGQIREENLEAETEQPMSYLGGEVLGGAVTSIGGMGAARGAVRTADALRKAGAGRKLTGIGKYAIPAAVEGGIYGAGISEADLTQPSLEEVGELAKDVAITGGIGLGAGVALPLGAKGIKKGLELTKDAGDALQRGISTLAEDRPFFGAMRAGLRGQAIYSRPRVEQLLKEPSEKLAYELAKEVSDLGERVAKPASQKIEDAYRKTLEKAGQDLKLKGEEFSTFINSQLDEFGETIGTIFKQAEEAGTTVDISDILNTAAQKIEGLTLTGTESVSRAKSLVNQFNKNLFDEIKTERKITQMFREAPDGQLIPESRSVETKGKDITPAQLTDAEIAPQQVTSPRLAKEVITDFPGQDMRLVERTAAEEIVSREPIERVSLKLARALKDTLGDTAGDTNIEGALRSTAGEAYSGIKSALSDVFADKAEYMAANRGYAAVKDLLEMVGVKDIEADRITGDTLTPERFARIFERIGNAFKESDFYTYNRIMEKLKQIAPEAGETFDQSIRQISEGQAEMIALRKAAPIEKGRTLLERGRPELRGAIDELTDVEQLRTQIGELDPIKRQLTQPGEYVELPESKVRNFLARQGQGYFDGVPGASEDVNATLNILKKYNPELVEKITTEGAELAELSRLGRITSKTDAITGEATFSPRGVVLGSLSQLIVAGANIAGLAGRKIGANQLINVLNETPEILGKFYQPLKEAAQAGTVPFSITANILAKEDPEFRDIVDNIGQQTGFNEKVVSDQDLIKNYLQFMPENQIPGEYNQFIKPLRGAIDRGEGSLRSTIYMLSQQYPQFRKFMEELKKSK